MKAQLASSLNKLSLSSSCFTVVENFLSIDANEPKKYFDSMLSSAVSVVRSLGENLIKECNNCFASVKSIEQDPGQGPRLPTILGAFEKIDNIFNVASKFHKSSVIDQKVFNQVQSYYTAVCDQVKNPLIPKLAFSYPLVDQNGNPVPVEVPDFDINDVPVAMRGDEKGEAFYANCLEFLKKLFDPGTTPEQRAAMHENQCYRMVTEDEANKAFQPNLAGKGGVFATKYIPKYTILGAYSGALISRVLDTEHSKKMGFVDPQKDQGLGIDGSLGTVSLFNTRGLYRVGGLRPDGPNKLDFIEVPTIHGRPDAELKKINHYFVGCGQGSFQEMNANDIFVYNYFFNTDYMPVRVKITLDNIVYDVYYQVAYARKNVFANEELTSHYGWSPEPFNKGCLNS